MYQSSNQSPKQFIKPASSLKHQRCILFIIDGLGDLPCIELGYKTPLEAAVTPVLDQMAGAGSYGLVDPISPGQIPNTHSGTGMLMGMLPQQAKHLHRGPVEASGAGRVLSAGDIALRANFASIEQTNEGLMVTDRRAGRITSGTAELAALINDIDLGDGIRAWFLPTDQHRAALVLSGPGLDANISNTDPGDKGMPALVRHCRALQAGAEFTADKINRFIKVSQQRLHTAPINKLRKEAGQPCASGIITRGAGAQFDLDNILHSAGVSAAVVSGCNTVLGLGGIFGFDTPRDTRFTATVNTNLDAKIAAAVAALENYEMVFLHVKAPDLFSHDRQPLLKRDFLQRLDQAMAPLLDTDITIALAADHSTDSNSGFHTADPVPSFIWQPRKGDSEDAINFGESSCRDGNSARQTANEFLHSVLNTMGYSTVF